MFQRKNERFYHGRRSHPLRNLCLSLLIFLCVCGLFFGGISHLSVQAKQEQKNSLENALWHGVSQYYALEGRYPQSLQELKDCHFGRTCCSGFGNLQSSGSGL